MEIDVSEESDVGRGLEEAHGEGLRLGDVKGGGGDAPFLRRGHGGFLALGVSAAPAVAERGVRPHNVVWQPNA